VGKIRVLYFLEDRAQEGFIKALVARIGQEESIATAALVHDVRSARGGSRIVQEFKTFIKDTRGFGVGDIDFLVVGIDGNCKGHEDRVRQLKKYIKEDHPFSEKVVYAVPDPHIERWYLMDQRAVKAGMGLDRAPSMPAYKCKKAHYKQVLNQALKESNVTSLLGGTEYAEQIVNNIKDLGSLYQQNAGFKVFMEGLRRKFRESKTAE